jgi:hypothetical protein
MSESTVANQLVVDSSNTSDEGRAACIVVVVVAGRAVVDGRGVTKAWPWPAIPHSKRARHATRLVVLVMMKIDTKDGSGDAARIEQGRCETRRSFFFLPVSTTIRRVDVGGFVGDALELDTIVCLSLVSNVSHA